MNIFFYVDKMRSYLRAGDWDGLEEQYERVAEKLAGKTSTLKIKNIDLKPYQKELAKQLAVAIKKANKTKAKAIYFEYDLDNGWESSYFICQTYSSESEGDDEWASDWLNSVEGPSCAELAAQYDRSFDKTGMAGGINSSLSLGPLLSLGALAKR